MSKILTLIILVMISTSSFAQDSELVDLTVESKQITFTGDTNYSLILSKVDSFSAYFFQGQNLFYKELSLLNKKMNFTKEFIQYAHQFQFELVANDNLTDILTSSRLTNSQKSQLINDWLTKNVPTVGPRLITIPYIVGTNRIHNLKAAIELLYQYYLAEVRLSQAHPLQ